MRLLIVEDEGAHSERLMSALRASKSVRTMARVVRASSAVEMLAEAKDLEGERLLVVLDLVLGNGESGFEVLRYLHSRVRAPQELPVIVWTQYGDEVTKTICGYFRVPGFVSKSEGDDLNVAAVRSAVEDYRAQRYGRVN